MTVIAAKYRVGRVFRQIRRCLVARDGKPVLMAELLDYAFPRAGGRHPHWHHQNIYRCLDRYAVPIDRLNHRPDRPYLYGPNEQLRAIVCGKSLTKFAIATISKIGVCLRSGPVPVCPCAALCYCNHGELRLGATRTSYSQAAQGRTNLVSSGMSVMT